MKKIQFLLVAVALAAGCTKDAQFETQNVTEPSKDIQIALDITKAGDSKAIQSGFQSGNAVLVFFNHDLKYDGTCKSRLDNKYYLTMKYNGSEWTSEINSEYLNSLPKSGTMDAIYVSDYDAAAFYTFYGGIDGRTSKGTTSLNTGADWYYCYDILTKVGQPYTIESGQLKGNIALERPKKSYDDNIYSINLQISISDLPAGDWYFKDPSGLATIPKVGYCTYNNNSGENCAISYSNRTSQKYVKLQTVGTDKVAYFHKWNQLTADVDYTFFLYNNTENRTYKRSIYSGRSVEENTFQKKWGDVEDNVAFKMSFSSFEEVK